MSLFLCTSLAACPEAAPPAPRARAPRTKADAAKTTAAASDVAGATKIVEMSAYDARFLVPATWTATRENDVYILSGPRRSAAHATTISFEAYRRRSAGGAIEDAIALKAELLEELRGKFKDGQVLRTVAVERDGFKGLRLETRFEHEGTRFRKDQLLFNKDDQVLTISYNAPESLFEASLPIWTQAVESLTLRAKKGSASD